MTTKLDTLKKKTKNALPFIMVGAATVVIAGFSYYIGRKSAPNELANLYLQWAAKAMEAPEGTVVLLAPDETFVLFRPTE